MQNRYLISLNGDAASVCETDVGRHRYHPRVIFAFVNTTCIVCQQTSGILQYIIYNDLQVGRQFLAFFGHRQIYKLN